MPRSQLHSMMSMLSNNTPMEYIGSHQVPIWLCTILLGGCVGSDYGLGAIQISSDEIGDGRAAAEALTDLTFVRGCGKLQVEQAQSINNAEAGESLLAEVYGRSADCASGNSALDCTYLHEGTLVGAGDFPVETTTEFDVEYFYREYVSVGGSVNASALLGLFSFESSVRADSYLEITASHISQSNLPFTEEVAAAAVAYGDQHSSPGWDLSYIDQVAIDLWTAYEFRRIDADAEASAATQAGVYEIGGEFYSEIATEKSVYIVNICVEPIN